jgi:uncharacterized protein YkwD
MKRLVFAALLGLLPCLPLPAEAPRLLVVPFENKGAAGEAWLASGLEEALLSDLAKLKGVKTVSRSERKRAADELGAGMDAKAGDRALRLGRSTGAAVVLSGEYLAAGGEIGVKARLAAVGGGTGGTALAEVEAHRSLAQAAVLSDELILTLFSAAAANKAAKTRLPALSAEEIRAVQGSSLSAAEFEYRGRELALDEPVPQEFLDIEEAVFLSLNRERAAAGLPPFAYSRKLAALGRYHSRNMAKDKFFDFVDRDGLDSEGRKQKLAPGLFGGVGQLIAYNYGGSAAEVAGKLVKQWMASSSRSQLLDPDYRAVGVGVFRGEEAGFRYYCTVVPADLYAELVSSMPPAAKQGDDLELLFRFDGAFPKAELSVIVRFPDKTVRVYRKDGSYTEGFGFYAPQGWDGDFFTIRFSCDKGRGTYLIQAARGEEFIPAGLSFAVE